MTGRTEHTDPVQTPSAIAPLVTSCLVCGAGTKRVLNDVYDLRFGVPGNFEIRRCEECDLEQISPVLGQDQLSTLYERYYNFRHQDTANYSKTRHQLLRSGVYRLWVRIDGDISFVLRPGRGRRLLDVGCNEGRNLLLYQTSGFRAEGVEINRTAADKAIQLGCRVHVGPLESVASGLRFDVVVLSNVLEHVASPTAMLDAAFRLLEPGGELWVSCPNAESFARRLFERSWINWHPPFHLIHFTAATLARLMAAAGFEVIDTKSISPALWLAQSLVARRWAKPGAPTLQMRKPLIIAPLLVLIRAGLFPFLWIENRKGRGDCLVAVAHRPAA